MAILGITSTENWSSYRDTNYRRSVQYFYPQGKAPLLGLLSLLDSEEPTNDPYYAHFEYRYATPRTLTASQGTNKGPFLNSGGTDLGDHQTITAGTQYYVCVDDASPFQVANVIRIKVDSSSADDNIVLGNVTAVDSTSTPNTLKFKALTTLALVKNTTTDENVDKEVLYAGKAFAEGRSNIATAQRTVLPTEVYNYPQIHRTPITFTGRELKTPVKFDESGTYKHRTREQLINHMVGIEQMLFWGNRYKDYSAATVDPTTGAGLPTTYSGGLLWYLQQWEMQYSLYRGGDGSSTGPAAVTSDSDDNKRIIENSTGVMTEELWDTYLERIFRFTSNTSSEKLWIGGNKQLAVLTQLARSKSQQVVKVPHDDAYGYVIYEWVSPFGTLYLKTHPLFNENPALLYDAFILDVHNLKYRPYQDRDTKLLKNRHARDFDGRTDEWFSDVGLEMWQPESCMYMKNVQSFTP